MTTIAEAEAVYARMKSARAAMCEWALKHGTETVWISSRDWTDMLLDGIVAAQWEDVTDEQLAWLQTTAMHVLMITNPNHTQQGDQTP